MVVSLHLWYSVNKSRRKHKRITPIRNDDGILLTNVDDIRNDWSNYYADLFNCYAGERDAAFAGHPDTARGYLIHDTVVYGGTEWYERDSPATTAMSRVPRSDSDLTVM